MANDKFDTAQRCKGLVCPLMSKHNDLVYCGNWCALCIASPCPDEEQEALRCSLFFIGHLCSIEAVMRGPEEWSRERR